MRIFFPFAKIDAEQRLVYGYASTEAKDDQGETVSLPALKAALPDYMRFGNIREMHQLSAVGVAKEAAVDDKGLYLGGKIVDDRAWAKVVAGVYKGFSIGGRVTERNPSDASNITGLQLSEISLVDRPANPEATFDCWKAAGEGEAENPAPEVQPVPAPSPIASAEAAIAEVMKALGRVETATAEAAEIVAKAAEKADGDGDADDMGEAAKGGDEPGNGKNPYGDVKYADPGYQSDGKKRYPIDTEAHCRAALSYINHPSNGKKYSAEHLAAIKARIHAACKHFGIEVSEKAGNDVECADYDDESGEMGKAAAGQDGAADQHSTVNTAGNAEHAAPQATPPASRANPEANSTVDTEPKSHAQAIHDAAVSMGAMCGGAAKAAAPAADSGELKKALDTAAAERDALHKALAEMAPRLDALAKRVEEIAAQPLPPKAVARPDGLQNVTKAQDNGGAAPAALGSPEAIVAAYNALSPQDKTMAAIKATLAQPRALPGFSDAPMPRAGR